MQNSIDASGCESNELDLIEAFIRAGAERLFSQFNKSSGYLSMGNTQIAEAAIVMHVASSASQFGHTFWPESPFRDRPDEGRKHLDLLIDLNPDKYKTPVLVTVEGKAVSEGVVAKKIREIVRDYGRVCEWNRLDRDGVPIFFVLNDPRCVYGALVVLCTEKLGLDRRLPEGSFSSYWKTLDGGIDGASDSLRDALNSKLRKAIRKDVVDCVYEDGGIHYSVAYALFESTEETSGTLRHTAEHEAAHAIVAIMSGLKVKSIALIEEGHLMGGVECDWKDVAYRCGRLFALLEKAQLAALGKDLNSTIKDRYLAAASATPAIIFPRLLRVNTHHLAKLTRASQGFYTNSFGGLMAEPFVFPRQLSLEQQGRFFIGYFQERQYRPAVEGNATEESVDTDE